MAIDTEMLDAIQTVIQKALEPVTERLTTLEAGQEELKQDVRVLKAGQEELKAGQAVLEAKLDEQKATNRRTHIEVFRRLDYIQDDIRRLSGQKERAIQ